LTENVFLILQICIYSDISASVEIYKGKGREISIPNTENIPKTGILSKVFTN
jgi:hypothetical protein